jgi:hypothetical protein
MWRRHAILLALLGGVAVPVYWWDQNHGPGCSGFICLDLRGLFVGAYLAWFIIHAVVTTLLLTTREPRGLLLLTLAHVGGGVISAAILFILGISVMSVFA